MPGASKRPLPTSKCPHCGKELTKNNMKKHIGTCSVKPSAANKLTLSQLRKYLQTKIIARHPSCPICRHRFRAQITMDMLNGVRYVDIIKSYSGSKNQPVFNEDDLGVHKRHLHLDRIAVMEVAAKRAQNLPAHYNVQEISTRGGGNVKLLTAIAAAIMDKTQKLQSLELTQLAKLEIAQQLRDKLQNKDNVYKMLYEFAKHVEANELYEAEEAILHVEKYLHNTEDNLEELFLKYMNSIGDLQLKLLAFYKEIPTNSYMNTRIIMTIVQNTQLAVLRKITDLIKDTDLRFELLTDVGKSFNDMNMELRSIIDNSVPVETNPVDAVYEELRSNIVQNIRGGEVTDDITV